MNWHALAVGAILLATAATPVRAADLMTFAEISLRVRMGDAPQTILNDTAQRKLIEPLTAEQEAALKKAGASDAWLAALRAPALVATPEARSAYQSRKDQQKTQLAPEASPRPAVRSTPPAVQNDQAHLTDLVKVGDAAPDFTARAVGGKDISLSALKGRVSLVIIVTTDSEPCARELTAIERYIWAKFRDHGLTVIGLGSGAALPQLIEYKTRNHFTFDFAEDPQKAITARYATDYVPRCYVVGKDGLVKFTSIGLNKNDFLRMLNIIESETGK